MATNTIGILGCGWLGLPLAKALLENGYPVKGSTTSENKLAVLEQNGIKPYLVSLSESGISGDIAPFLNGTSILVIDIPPKLRGEQKENFVAKIQKLIPFIENSGIEKVLFISSTAVYADDNNAVTQHTIPNPDTESGRQLLEAEKLLQGNSHFQTNILRFGGLIGEDRHPVKFLAGKEHLENPDGPINLIHQKDCIGIISQLIEKNVWGVAFNAAHPNHPTRQGYYTGKAKSLGLPLPQFDHSKTSVGKTINSRDLMEFLDYTFFETP